jgi:electron transport complex protein RnfC
MRHPLYQFQFCPVCGAKAFVEHNGMECCECGCCSFICPAKRPLTQEIKSMRKMILADRKKK